MDYRKFRNSARIIFVLCLVDCCDGGAYCGSSQTYCENGCCDNSCCADGFSTVQIVGLVIGGLIGLATLVGCLVCFIWMCKSASYDRHSVQPYNNSNSVYVNNMPYATHPRPGPPPGYGQHYGYSTRPSNPYYNDYNDPVYPPGMVQGNQPASYHPPPAYTASTSTDK